MSFGSNRGRSRLAVDASRRSPMSWPSASLTSRRRSTSTISTATSPPSSLMRRNASAMRSSAAGRLSRPVIESCSSRCSSCAMAIAFVGDVATHHGDVAAVGVTSDRDGRARSWPGRDAARPGAPMSMSPLPDTPLGVDEESLWHLIEHVRNDSRPSRPTAGDGLRPDELAARPRWRRGSDRRSS